LDLRLIGKAGEGTLRMARQIPPDRWNGVDVSQADDLPYATG